MNLYLLRHGIAADRDFEKFPNDDERPLTEDGIAKMRRIAKGIGRLMEGPDVILTSPLVRTSQTANLVAKALGCRDRVEASDALKPGATVGSVRVLLATRAGQGAGEILMVGHEPDMGQIASGLIGAPEVVVEFKKGSFCAIRLDPLHSDRPGVLLWHLTPRQLRSIGRGS